MKQRQPWWCQTVCSSAIWHLGHQWMTSLIFCLPRIRNFQRFLLSNKGSLPLAVFTCIYVLFAFRLSQGSQTQLHRGATLRWKMPLRAAVLNKKTFAGHNIELEKTPYIVQNLAIFDLFYLSMIKIFNFVALNESLGPRVWDPWFK